MGFFTQIKEKLVGKSTKQNEKYVVGLDKSSETFSDRINELAARFREINDEYFEELENILIMADVGVSMVIFGAKANFTKGRQDKSENETVPCRLQSVY